MIRWLKRLFRKTPSSLKIPYDSVGWEALQRYYNHHWWCFDRYRNARVGSPNRTPKEYQTYILQHGIFVKISYSKKETLGYLLGLRKMLQEKRDLAAGYKLKWKLPVDK